jgi:2-keto-4-pentenoate hydratase/2-oxohepta-3-ene-1,7-dioic acid hydratase in catechol pathway
VVDLSGHGTVVDLISRPELLASCRETLEREKNSYALEGLSLCAPVPRPGKIVGVARNYQAHAIEQGQRKVPSEPVLFLKASSSSIGSGAPIVLPAVSREVDYEGELVAVIGRTLYDVDPGEALACVAGYTVGNDVSARDFQNVRGQRFVGKSCDSFAPMGPVLITPDEIGDPQNLRITTEVSGERLQNGNTRDMTFPIGELLSFASRLMTFEAGDVFFTGTPEGVGRARTPPRYLRDGDVVEVTVEGIGTLRNPVRASA